MAIDPRDLYLRSQEDKDTDADPRDLYLRSQEDKESAPASVTGTVAVTLGDVTSAADGQVGLDVTGTVSLSLADLISTASGTVAVPATDFFLRTIQNFRDQEYR